MKIICMIRCHNSAWIIDKTLNAIAPCVDGIVIHDHNSTDNTVEICKKYEKVLNIFQTKNKEYHEGRDKCILLNMARKYNPEWFLILDDDEIVTSEFNNILKECNNTEMVYAFPLLYLWEDKNKVRYDFPWGRQIRTKLFPNKKEIYFPMKKCHCTIEHNCINMFVSYPIIHYGYCKQSLIDEKLKLYSTFDDETNQISQNKMKEMFTKKGKYCTIEEAMEKQMWLK